MIPPSCIQYQTILWLRLMGYYNYYFDRKRTLYTVVELILNDATVLASIQLIQFYQGISRLENFSGSFAILLAKNNLRIIFAVAEMTGLRCGHWNLELSSNCDRIPNVLQLKGCVSYALQDGVMVQYSILITSLFDDMKINGFKSLSIVPSFCQVWAVSSSSLCVNVFQSLCIFIMHFCICNSLRVVFDLFSPTSILTYCTVCIVSPFPTITSVFLSVPLTMIALILRSFDFRIYFL